LIRTVFYKICIIFLIATALYACRTEPPAVLSVTTPRLILLYVTCTLNKDYLSPYNDKIVFTPHIDRFSREAAVFSNHQVESGLSGTSFASIYTGVQADQHGVFSHPQRLDTDLYMIFESFADAGYDTFHWAKHPMVAKPKLNYSQGVDTDNIIKKILTKNDKRFRAVLERIQTDKNYRALVVASFTVTHGPYKPDHLQNFRDKYPKEAEGITPKEVEKYYRIFEKNYFHLQTNFTETVKKLKLTEKDITRLAAVVDIIYKSRVNFLDSHFGGIVNVIKKYDIKDESLVVFTADHGETLYQEERPFKWTHGPDLAPEVINVPFIIRGQHDIIPARKIDDVTRSIDIYPSLAGLSSIQLPDKYEIQGIDLSQAMCGNEGFPKIRAYSHSTLRHGSFFESDLIDNIRASLRAGDN